MIRWVTIFLRTSVTCILLLSIGIFPISAASFSAGSSNSATIASPILLGLVNEGGTSGLLIEVIREISRRSNVTLSVETYPSLRGAKRFIGKHVDGVMPVLDIEMEHYEGSAPYRTVPLIFRRDFAFVRKTDEIPRSPEDLDGKSIVSVLGYGLDPSILNRENIHFQAVRNDLIALHMLTLGRADVYISDEFVVLKALREAEIDNVHHDPSSPMFIYGGSILFHRNEKGKAIFSKINRAIKGMWSDGTMEKMLPSNLPSELTTKFINN